VLWFKHNKPFLHRTQNWTIHVTNTNRSRRKGFLSPHLLGHRSEHIAISCLLLIIHSFYEGSLQSSQSTPLKVFQLVSPIFAPDSEHLKKIPDECRSCRREQPLRMGDLDHRVSGSITSLFTTSSLRSIHPRPPDTL
jgi:hypothetical protein